MKWSLPTILIGVALSLPAERQPARFLYERVILPGAAGLSQLPIDLPLLAGAAPFRELSRERASEDCERAVIARDGLDDLRIYDSAGREIPYLIWVPPAAKPSWPEGRVTPVPPTETASGFEMDLGRIATVDRLRVWGLPSTFMKSARVEGSEDAKQWTVLVEDAKLFDLPKEQLWQLEIAFQPCRLRYCRLTWNDVNSPRLPLPETVAAREVPAWAPAAPLRLPLEAVRRRGGKGESRYLLPLPAAQLPLIAIELTATGTNVLRKARVAEAPASKDELALRTLGMASLWHVVSGRSEIRIPIEAPRKGQLELTLSEEGNPPLRLTGATAVFASLPWIYFESPGREPLTARFGSPGLAPPQYDVASMRDAIAKSDFTQARWGESRGRSPSVLRSILFWILPLAAALAIGLFIVRRRQRVRNAIGKNPARNN